MRMSVAIPVHDMPNADYFLTRIINSLHQQTFRDFEIVITKTGWGMAKNINECLRRCKGDIIKILFMDDYMAYPEALWRIATQISDSKWMASGCLHTKDGANLTDPHYPTHDEIALKAGFNPIGSPSVITMQNGLNVFMDESLTWVVDCDWYARMYSAYGPPKLDLDLNVVIGVGNHQSTNNIPLCVKDREHQYIQKKYK